jgi:hypothetical protein
MTEINVELRPPMTLATRRVSTTPDDLGEAIGITLMAVMEILGPLAEGNPAIVRYLKWGEIVALEVGYEVDEPVENLTLTRVAGGPAAVAIHVGHYNELGEVTADVSAWVAEHGGLAGVPYERYLDNPDEVPVEQLRTEIVWPIKPT